MIEPERKVHPIAAAFPMIPDAELDELAAHIKANGLLNSIKLGPDGSIWDGRNRDAACKRAGVEPWYETVPEGVDALAYILGQNDHRRHNSTGQRAMAAALAVKKDEELSTGGQSVSGAAREASVHRSRVAEALTVLEWAPDLAPLVLDGTRYLKDTYAEARRRKDEKASQDERDARELAEVKAKTAKLREKAPDLAELVGEWRLSLDVAVAELDKREDEEKERRERDTAGFARATSYLAALLGQEPARIARDWLPKANTYASIAGCETLWTADGLRDLARRLGEAADAWRE